MKYMLKQKIKDFLAEQTMDDIVQAANEIYDYRYTTGILPQNSVIEKFGKDLEYKNYRDICDAIEEFICEKMGNLIVLCLREHAEQFIGLQ